MRYCFCWRCQREMPMLDEEEYAEIRRLIQEVVRKMRETPGIRKGNGEGYSMRELFKPVRDEYERMTGWRDMHQNVIMHHRLELLGPDCPKCSKPLRTPEARCCVECGWKRGRIARVWASIIYGKRR